MIDLTSFDALMKEYYTDNRIADMAFKRRPLMSMIKKRSDITGKVYVHPVMVDDPQGAGRNYQAVKAGRGAASQVDFNVNLVRHYAFAEIDGMALELAKPNRGAFLDISKTSFDRMFNKIANDLHIASFGDGTYVRTTVSAIAGTTVTLADRFDYTQFSVGQKLQGILSTATASGVPYSGEIYTVVAKDDSLGTIELDSVGSLAVGDFLIQLGDSVSQNGLGILGLEAWLPFALSPSDNFAGVNRNLDRTALAGVAIDAPTLSADLERAIKLAGVELAARGAMPDVALCHPADFDILSNTVENTGRRFIKDDIGTLNLGFDAIRIGTAAGAISVVADHQCPRSRAYVLDTNSWELISAGTAPSWLMHDGNKVLRPGDADSIVGEAKAYSNMVCSAPGHNAVIKLT